MTQLEAAKKGQITESMHQVARQEGVPSETIREKVAADDLFSEIDYQGRATTTWWEPSTGPWLLPPASISCAM